MWCLSQTNADDLVRGRKRQRKKAPKAKTGCATCKIRRVKCDEEKPHCKKCTSTGRHCDGYAQSASAPAYASYADAEPTHISARMPIGVAKASCPSPSFGDFQQSMFDAIWTKGLVCIERFPRNCPVPASLSRAFDYFLHHSSPSLEGLPHIQNWQSYILSISVRSPAIQHAVAALSGLHERYSFPTDHDSEHRQEGWRQYYLSTKQVSVLIDTVQSDTGDGAGAEEEVLVACAIFIAIEILFGDIKTAIRHLKSGISLVQGFLAERHTRISNFQTSQGPSTSQNGRSPTGAASLRSYLDGHLLDLIGFLAFIDLQMMSFLPPDQYVASEDASSQLLSVALQSCRSLPDSLSTKLYFTVSRALHWIRYEAYRYKYHDPKSSALFETQLCLIAQLLAWRHTFNETGETETKPESVNLLLTFHLTLLKLHTALSSTECIFEDTICMDLYRAIMRYATIVLQNRKTERPATRQLSLETNTIEAVYYSAIKCRDVSLRRRAVSLLQCVGREGVWDGLAMAVIAEHAIRLEEAGSSATNTFPCGGVFHMCSDPAVAFQPALQEACDDWRYTSGSQVSRRNMALKSLINEITFSVDRDKRNVKVKCGWFCGEKRLWKFDARSLVW